MDESTFRSGQRSAWGWQPRRSSGIWKYGPDWARPLVAAVPWLTVGLALLLLALVDGRLVSAPGVLFSLPGGRIGEDAAPRLVALLMPVPRGMVDGVETLVYFDDARFMLSDPASIAALSARLEQRATSGRSDGALLLLADRRVPSGEVMKVVNLARASGLRAVQVAEKGE